MALNVSMGTIKMQNAWFEAQSWLAKLRRGQHEPNQPKPNTKSSAFMFVSMLGVTEGPAGFKSVWVRPELILSVFRGNRHLARYSMQASSLRAGGQTAVDKA